MNETEEQAKAVRQRFPTLASRLAAAAVTMLVLLMLLILLA